MWGLGLRAWKAWDSGCQGFRATGLRGWVARFGWNESSLRVSGFGVLRVSMPSGVRVEVRVAQYFFVAYHPRAVCCLIESEIEYRRISKYEWRPGLRGKLAMPS